MLHSAEMFDVNSTNDTDVMFDVDLTDIALPNGATLHERFIGGDNIDKYVADEAAPKQGSEAM